MVIPDNVGLPSQQSLAAAAPRGRLEANFLAGMLEYVDPAVETERMRWSAVPAGEVPHAKCRKHIHSNMVADGRVAASCRAVNAHK